MFNSTLPAITLDYSVDNEYTFTAIDRITKSIVAAAISYDCVEANQRIDLQLIELGYEVYNTDDIYTTEDFN